MKLRDQYDWVVFGDHPAALLAGAIVAHAGLSVLMLPLSPTQGFTISKSGQCFDPESNCIVGLGTAQGLPGLIREVLMRLGVWSELAQKSCQPLWPQIATPQARLALFGDEQDLKYELHRTLALDRGVMNSFMGDRGGLKQLDLKYIEQANLLLQKVGLTRGSPLANVPPVKVGIFMSQLDQMFKKHLSSLKLNDLVSAFSHWVRPQVSLPTLGSGVAHWMGMYTQSELQVKEFLRLWCASRVTSAFQGGISSYREFLRAAAISLGAHVPNKTVMKRLFIENGHFAGVQLANWGSMISVKGGILGAPIHALTPYLTYTGRSWFVRTKRAPKIIGWKMTIALTINIDVIPVGMLSRLMWQELGAPGLEIEMIDPAGYPSSGNAMDLGASSAKSRILYLRTVMPWTAESLTPAFQTTMASRMLSQAMKLMPFLEYHVTLIYPDFRASEKPSRLFRSNDAAEEPVISVGDTQFAEIYEFTELDQIPANLLVYDAKRSGVGYTSGIGSLYVASEESYPALGSFGGVVAALESTGVLLEEQRG